MPPVKPNYGAGDKVQCIDALGTPSLFRGATYTVDHIRQEQDGYWVVYLAIGSFVDGPWFTHRFELATNEHATATSESAQSIAVNDHVCPTCQNNRCSKKEKTCWRCGGAL